MARRLPGADVKGAPTAGWFFPAALPGDLPDIYPPSDFAHFYAGTRAQSTNTTNRVAESSNTTNWVSQLYLIPPGDFASVSTSSAFLHVDPTELHLTCRWGEETKSNF